MRQIDKTLLAAQDLRRQVVEARLTRRELLKLGLLSGSGLLALGGGLKNAIAKGSSNDVAVATTLPSPPTRPFVVEMPIPPTLPAVQSLNPHPTVEPNAAAGEGRSRDHQALRRFAPQEFYEMRFRQGMHVWHPDLPPGPVWGANGIFPGPMLYMRYGKPALVRMYNDLPAQNLGFGIPSISTHLHNGHTPSESDGFPGDYHTIGQWYDHHYPNQCAGIDAYGDRYSQYGAMGDYREALGTMWYHDHRLDFTAQNVYAGMAGMAPIYDNLDSGDEHDSNPLALRLPSGEYDVPLIFHDRVFDSQGRSFFDLFNLDGIIGDKFTVNGVVQPYFSVQRRKYRFRMLNIGPSRFYRWFMSDGRPFTVIANDGNLLPAPVAVRSIWQSVAERFDIVVDFSQYKVGERVRLLNRANQTDGRGPDDDLLNPGIPVLEFRVDADPPQRDESRVPNPATAPAAAGGPAGRGHYRTAVGVRSWQGRVDGQWRVLQREQGERHAAQELDGDLDDPQRRRRLVAPHPHPLRGAPLHQLQRPGAVRHRQRPQGRDPAHREWRGAASRCASATL